VGKFVTRGIVDKMSRDEAQSAANRELEARIQSGRPSADEFHKASARWVTGPGSVPDPSRPAGIAAVSAAPADWRPVHDDLDDPAEAAPVRSSPPARNGARAAPRLKKAAPARTAKQPARPSRAATKPRPATARTSKPATATRAARTAKSAPAAKAAKAAPVTRATKAKGSAKAAPRTRPPRPT
jgi:hypothetical protein